MKAKKNFDKWEKYVTEICNNYYIYNLFIII